MTTGGVGVSPAPRRIIAFRDSGLSLVLLILFFIMWLITQLRANIPRCAAKEMQIESKITKLA